MLRRATPAVVIAVALCLAAPVHGVGQSSTSGAAIRGSVVEAETNRPVQNATVRLIPVSGDIGEAGHGEAKGDGKVTDTDEGGWYAFAHIPAGRYRIEVTGLGYRPTHLWIDLPADWQIHRSVALEVQPVELDPLEIVLPVSPPRVASALTPVGAPTLRMPEGASAGLSPKLFGLDMRVLDPERLPGVGALGEPDIFRALQRLPGVSARGDYADDVWTRGAPWGMTQIILDGLPLYDPLHVGGIAAGLAADGLESVALYPGTRPPSSTEGAAGTIELTTRPARKRTASAGISSLALRAHAEDRFLDDRLGVSVTARRSWWDMVRPPSFLAASASRDAIDYHFADVAARLDGRVSWLGMVEAGGLWEGDRLNGDITDLVSKSRGEWGNQMGWVRLSRTFGSVRAETRLGSVAYRVRTTPMAWSAFFGPDGIPSLEHVETSIHHTSLDMRVRGGHGDGRFTWGVGMRGLREALSQEGIDAGDRGVPGIGDPATLRRLRAWAEASVTLGPVDVAGGVSGDAVKDVPTSQPVLPSFRVRWTPLSWLTLEGARADATQFVYPLAPAGTTLGPALGAGYTWVMAGGEVPRLLSHSTTSSAVVLLPHGLTAHLVGWWRRIEGLWFTGVSGLHNGGRVPADSEDGFGRERGRGVEMRIGWKNERAAAEVAYSRERSRYRDAGELEWPSPSERRHSLDAHVSAAVNDVLNVGFDFTSESGWPLVLGPAVSCGDTPRPGCVDYPTGERAPDTYSFSESPRYQSLDVRVEWAHRWDHLTLGVVGSVRNLLGRENPAAYRSGTCDGAELFSSVCEESLGQPRFSAGLDSPTPSVAVRIRF